MWPMQNDAKKSWKMTESLAHGLDGSDKICVLVLWMKVAWLLEGLTLSSLEPLPSSARFFVRTRY